MGEITKINHWKEKDLFFIDINGKTILKENGKKFSIRGDVFPAMNLSVGTEITETELKEFEKFVWKKLYGPESWEKEKIRINKVKELIENINPDFKVNIVGFGANSEEILLYHPEESGSPDLKVTHRENDKELFLVEVTGTERMREIEKSEYWVRPDKLNYIEKHPEKDIWIILHYSKPKEKFVFIKPIKHKEYTSEKEEIRSAKEKYVKFTDESEEFREKEEFSAELLKKLT